MKRAVKLVVVLVSGIGFSQTAQQLFEQGNELYRKGSFEQAVQAYERILDEHKTASAEVYFNLGNSYYKLGKIAPSVYNLEKALLLNPNDDAVKTNLLFAKKMTIDDIKEVHEVGFSKMIQNFTSLFSSNGWAWLSVAFSVLFLGAFLGYYFLETTGLKRFFFTAMFVFLGVLAVSLLSGYLEKRYVSNNRPAIVFAETAVVKSEPKNSSETAFELHEGTKVFVLETLDNWLHIQLANKTEGWISKSAVKEL